jgi:hypothetical protein
VVSRVVVLPKKKPERIFLKKVMRIPKPLIINQPTAIKILMTSRPKKYLEIDQQEEVSG